MPKVEFNPIALLSGSQNQGIFETLHAFFMIRSKEASLFLFTGSLFLK